MSTVIMEAGPRQGQQSSDTVEGVTGFRNIPVGAARHLAHVLGVTRTLSRVPESAGPSRDWSAIDNLLAPPDAKDPDDSQIELDITRLPRKAASTLPATKVIETMVTTIDDVLAQHDSIIALEAAAAERAAAKQAATTKQEKASRVTSAIRTFRPAVLIG